MRRSPAGPPYPYDYQGNTWDAQKHAYLQPGTAGAFEWNIRDNSGMFLKLCTDWMPSLAP
jgi:hypothetical protein